MKILIDGNCVARFAGESISFGTFEGEQKWKISDHMYALDNNYTLVDNVTLPTDYADGKYKYTDGEFVTNPNYKEYKSSEEQIAELQQAVATLITTNEILTSCLVEMSEIVYA